MQKSTTFFLALSLIFFTTSAFAEMAKEGSASYLGAKAGTITILTFEKGHMQINFDEAGVIVDVDVTTREDNEGKQLLEQVKRVEANTGECVAVVTADAAYAHPANYAPRMANRRVLPLERRTPNGCPYQYPRFQRPGNTGASIST